MHIWYVYQLYLKQTGLPPTYHQIETHPLKCTDGMFCGVWRRIANLGKWIGCGASMIGGNRGKQATSLDSDLKAFRIAAGPKMWISFKSADRHLMQLRNYMSSHFCWNNRRKSLMHTHTELDTLTLPAIIRSRSVFQTLDARGAPTKHRRVCNYQSLNATRNWLGL